MFSSPHPSLRRRLRAAVAVLPIVAASLSLTSPASAGSYRVYYCHTPDGTVAPMSDWVGTGTYDGGVTDQCPSDYVLRLGPGQHQAPQQTMAELDVPNGSVAIDALSVDRGAAILAPGSPGDSNATPYFGLDYGPNWLPTGEGCAYNQASPWSGEFPCRGVAWSGVALGSSAFSQGFPGGTNRLAYIVGCGSGGAGTCAGVDGSQSRVTLAIHAMTVTAEDDDAPRASVLASGSAVGATPLVGTASLAYSAADSGAGVYQSILSIDGREITRANVSTKSTCSDVYPSDGDDLEFTTLKPCPDNASFAQSFDTTKLSEGTHQLTVVVRDAAGNTANVVDRQITVDNIPPPVVNIAPTVIGGAPTGGLRPGDTVSSSDGTWTGSGIKFTHRWQRQNDAGAWVDIPNATGATYTVTTDDVGHALRVIVTATNSEGATQAATEATGAVRSGATVQTQSLAPTTPAPGTASTPAAADGGSSANGAGGDPTGGQLVLDREQKSVDVAYGAKIVITGRLVDSKNQPIANAKVDVFEQLVTTTARWNKIDTITTDSQGGYLYRPKTTASRTLRFAWAATIGTSDYQATREVLVSVTAGMTIKAAHRTVGRRSTIRLKGRVSIDGLPTTGAWVELQVLDNRVWRTVATRKLTATGLWTYKHRLTSSAAITFAFRSRLRATGDIAAAESKSAPLKVHVR